MPKLRGDDVSDIDVDLLEETEYTETDFETYDGEIPPAGTVLTGYVKSMWWCRTAVKNDGTGDDPMIKVLWIAAENEGELEEYNGLPVWENLVLTPVVKFRWAPFINNFGISLKAIKTQTYVAPDEDQFGAPIEKIGNFKPGEDNDEAWSRMITERHRWNEAWQARPKAWLPYDEDEEAATDTEPDEPDEPDEDETEPETEEEAEPDEDEQEAARPARAARGRSKPRGSTTAAKATTARTRTAAPAKGARPAAAASGRRGGRTKPAATTKPAARGRGRAAAADLGDDDPPF